MSKNRIWREYSCHKISQELERIRYEKAYHGHPEDSEPENDDGESGVDVIRDLGLSVEHETHDCRIIPESQKEHTMVSYIHRSRK